MKKIKSIEIKGSPFFENVKFDFSEKLNCIMGGRGTGKSTLLYLIKSAIFQNAESDKNVYGILKSNLGTGEIILEVESSDGTMYRIHKTFNDEPQPYKSPSSEFISIDKIFNEIECDFYETGKIEEIGRSEFDRLLLLDKKIKPIIAEFESEVKKIQIELDANAQDIKAFNQRILRIDDAFNQYNGVEVEFDEHKSKQPAGLKEEEKQEFEVADNKEKIRKNEKRFFNKTIELFNELKIEFELKRNEIIDSFKTSVEDKATFINAEIMNPSIAETEIVLGKINEQINSINVLINAHEKFINTQLSKLNDSHGIQQSEFIQLKQKFEVNRDYINKYHTLSKKISEKDNIQKDRKELLTKRDKLKSQRGALISKLNELKQLIFNERLKSIKELNADFGGAIVINLTFSGITFPFEEKLRDALKGNNMRYNELIPKIVQNITCDQFATIVHNKDVDKLMSLTGLDKSRSENIINVLYETEDIYEIERIYCDDLPEFKLRIHEGEMDEENYRRTEELSMGQRCTTVLPIIFAVSKNPLIIDQPEDNLDNKYISDKIHEIIRKQKEERQLIFITHNPNIPVLSDSENNIFLKFDRKSILEASGDVNAVKANIIELLEGGELAFKKRQSTYGY